MINPTAQFIKDPELRKVLNSGSFTFKRSIFVFAIYYIFISRHYNLHLFQNKLNIQKGSDQAL